MFDHTCATADRPRCGGVDDHPAGRQESAARQRIFELHPQDPRGLPRPADRERADQAADPRTLSQPDLPRPERLWRAGGRARLFRQGCRPARAARDRLSRDPAQGADQLRSRAPRRARDRAAQLGAERDGAQRLHHRGPARRRRRAAARHRPRRRPTPSATSAAISWRKSAASWSSAMARKPKRAPTASMPAACGCAPRSIRADAEGRRERAARRADPLRSRHGLARFRAQRRHGPAIGAASWRWPIRRRL